ncbi:MAG: glycoside hydrolase family 57 protein [Bacteroidaceae bacterium]|nr:glycoside hydrolase family 57 protein [Bacteroidaceae bacterium]
MKTICFYFEIHQIRQLKRYRFFDIGSDHYYYDDYANESAITEIAEKSYIPALTTLLEMVKENGGAFKVAFSVSGVGLEMLELYAPQVIELLHEINKTGCCEFLCEPYSHGLSSLASREVFMEEVQRQNRKIKELFGKKPKVLRNSGLIYSDEIGEMAASMGFKGMLSEGAKHILAWRSPHFVYNCATAPNLKLLLRDYKLSDDISLRFSNPKWSEYPLFAETYVDWIAQLPEEDEVINIFMNLHALGVSQPLSSHILDFLKAIPACAKDRGISFSTPSEIIDKHKSVGALEVSYPLSWMDEERDASSWLGNSLQREAFDKLYSLAERISLSDDKKLKQDFDYLQAAENLRFMTTKQNGIITERSIYESPYDAFTNYMNILGDFMARVRAQYPEEMDNEELGALQQMIENQEVEIVQLEAEVESLKAKLATKAKKAAKAAEPAEEKPAKEAKPKATKAKKENK